MEIFKLITKDDLINSELFNQEHINKTFNSNDKIYSAIYIASNIIDQLCGGRVRENWNNLKNLIETDANWYIKNHLQVACLRQTIYLLNKGYEYITQASNINFSNISINSQVSSNLDFICPEIWGELRLTGYLDNVGRLNYDINNYNDKCLNYWDLDPVEPDKRNILTKWEADKLYIAKDLNQWISTDNTISISNYFNSILNKTQIDFKINLINNDDFINAVANKIITNLQTQINNLETQITHLQNTNLWDIFANGKFKAVDIKMGVLNKPSDIDFTRPLFFKIGRKFNDNPISPSLYTYTPNFSIYGLQTGMNYDFGWVYNNGKAIIDINGILISSLCYTDIKQKDSLGNVNILTNIDLIFYYWQPTETEYKTQQILQGKEYLEPHIRLQKIKEQEKEKQKELNNGN